MKPINNNLKSSRKKRTASSQPYFKKRIRSQYITVFSRQMAIMLSAGIPLAQSLRIIQDGIEPSLKPIIQAIILDIEKGNSFHAALKKYPKIFDEFYCSLIAIGELSGSLDTLLVRLTTYKEKTEALTRKIKMAMIYPVAVLMIALSVIILLFTHVIPIFKGMFQEFKCELPLPTKILLACSEGLNHYGGIILLTILIFIKISLYCYRKYRAVQYHCHRFILKCPIIGNLIQHNILARFAWSLATALSAGVPLTEALDAVSNTTLNRVYMAAIQQLKQDLSTGERLYIAMRKTALFPPLVIRMIGVGEESGEVEKLLKKIAILYEEAFNDKLSSFVTLLEPLMMMILGLIIGAFVIGIYLPIFKMGSLF
jgi:type IV pilus assembly protein PilC